MDQIEYASGISEKNPVRSWWKETDFAEGATVNDDDLRKASLTPKYALISIINTTNISNNKVA